MKKYDGLYVFVNPMKDDEVDKQIERVSGEITRLSGVVLSIEASEKRQFARPMKKKHGSGVFVKIRFEMDPAQIQTLVTRYKLSEDVFRFQPLSVDERKETVLLQQAENKQLREEKRLAALERETAEAASAEEAEEV